MLEILSLCNLYPGVSFEVYPLSKIKIANVDLSQLLINKPVAPVSKLRTFQYGYLGLDDRNRLKPVLTKDGDSEPLVGVWVYGLDIPAYNIQLDHNPCLESNASAATNRENDKAQILNNPYVWLACTKFMHDQRVGKRMTMSSKDTFVIVHFFNSNVSPQFLEFRMVGSLNRQQVSKHETKAEITNIITFDKVNPKYQDSVDLESACRNENGIVSR